MRKIPVAALAGFFFLIAFSTSAFSDSPAVPQVRTYGELLRAIREARAASQARIEAAVEKEKVREAWETGKLIDEHVLQHKERADYGEQVLNRLSGDLGISASELRRMLEFSRAYPIYAHVRKLSWSDFRELLSINDPAERDAVAAQAEKENWSREQIREEVRRRKNRSEWPVELPAIAPGPLDTYQVVSLKGRLKIDLGFGIYRDLSEKDARKFKEGDIAQVHAGLRLKRSKPGMSSGSLYTYRAQVTRVADGDTFHALIDLGLGDTMAQRVRLRRIDAPELVSVDGKTAKDFLEKILSRDQGRVILQSRELDQHGRSIADVWVQGKPVDQELLDQGLAIQVRE